MRAIERPINWVESNVVFYAVWSWSNWMKVFWKSYKNPLGYRELDKEAETVKSTVFFIRELSTGRTWIRTKGDRWISRNGPVSKYPYSRCTWQSLKVRTDGPLVYLPYAVLESEDKQLADKSGADRA